MTTYEYKTEGTCSKRIVFSLEGEIIKSVAFEGGCNGNLKGVVSLVTGMSAKEVIARLEGITCLSKPTSCPDQLSRALKIALQKQEG